MAIDFLFDDYQVKLDYLKNQYDRLWTRFHFFLSVELTIFGFLGYLTYDQKSPEATTLPIVMGFFVSLLWYVVGAQDRALVEVYGERVRAAATRIAADREGLANYDRDHAAAEIGSRRNGFRSWYWPWISITRIPVTLAMILTVVWFVLFFTWGNYVRWYVTVAP